MNFLEFRSEFQKFGRIHGIPVGLTEHLLQDFQCRPWGVCGYFLEQPNITGEVVKSYSVLLGITATATFQGFTFVLSSFEDYNEEVLYHQNHSDRPASLLRHMICGHYDFAHFHINCDPPFSSLVSSSDYSDPNTRAAAATATANTRSSTSTDTTTHSSSSPAATTGSTASLCCRSTSCPTVTSATATTTDTSPTSSYSTDSATSSTTSTATSTAASPRGTGVTATICKCTSAV